MFHNEITKTYRRGRLTVVGGTAIAESAQNAAERTSVIGAIVAMIIAFGFAAIILYIGR